MRAVRVRAWSVVGALLLVGARQTAARDLAYVADLLAGSVSVIDTSTNQVSATIAVGLDPDGVGATPNGSFVYVTNFRSDNVSVIDTATNAVSATIAVGDGPVGVAFTPDGGTAYVANKNAATVSVIDTKTSDTTNVISVGSGAAPSAIAITPNGKIAYVTVSSTASPGSVAVIDTASNTLTTVLGVGGAPNRIAVTPNGAAAYVTDFRGRSVSVLDTQSNAIVATIPVGGQPSGLAISADGHRAYVAGTDAVSVIDTANNQVTATIPIGSSFRAVAITLNDAFAYVANFDASAVSVIDTRSNALVRTICTGGGPFAAAIVGVPDLPTQLTAKIIVPVSGFKLREHRTLSVRISVQAGSFPIQGWRVRLDDGHGSQRQIASGDGAVGGDVVAELNADDLVAGQLYTLGLLAGDAVGLTDDLVSFLVPDPQYTLIPLEAGNLSRPVVGGVTVDSSGDRVAFGGGYDPISQRAPIFVADATGVVSALGLPLLVNDAFRLSRNGQRLVFGGAFPDPPFTALGIATVDGAAIIEGPTIAYRPFSVDATGQRVVYQAFVPGADPDVPVLQYFLYDDATQQTGQLTTDLATIDRRRDFFASTPLITADGSRVVFASRATLGLVPADPNVSWHIFSYDVGNGVLQQVATVPSDAGFDVPVLSDDGRWLTYVTTRTDLPGISVGARLDLTTGLADSPIGAIRDYPTTDAVVSGDGTAIIVATRDDLDQRVGNSDHNVELFAYDVAGARFTQLTDTEGGAPGSPDVSYRPAANADARVAAFTFVSRPGFACPAAGSQRNAADGFFLGRVRAVRKRADNHAPRVDPVADIRVLGGDTLTQPLAATDADGDPVVFFAQLVGGTDLPPGAEIADHHDGTATFRWQTTPENEGTFALRIAAFDEGGGETLRTFLVAVCSRIITDDGTPDSVVGAIFETSPPPACRAADGNHDGAISAADAVAAVRG